VVGGRSIQRPTWPRISTPSTANTTARRLAHHGARTGASGGSRSAARRATRPKLRPPRITRDDRVEHSCAARASARAATVAVAPSDETRRAPPDAIASSPARYRAPAAPGRSRGTRRRRRHPPVQPSLGPNDHGRPPAGRGLPARASHRGGAPSAASTRTPAHRRALCPQRRTRAGLQLGPTAPQCSSAQLTARRHASSEPGPSG